MSKLTFTTFIKLLYSLFFLPTVTLLHLKGKTTAKYNATKVSHHIVLANENKLLPIVFIQILSIFINC